MNNWIIFGIVCGLLIVGGIAAVSAISASTDQVSPNVEATCTSCGGKCNAEANCGIQTCGAVNGGKCNCGR